ncbi:MAG: hypothetical protein Q9161_000005 [Pseudevernia consocians]
MDKPPFEQNLELCKTLQIADDGFSIKRRPRAPFKEITRDRATIEKNYLPGQPRVALQGASLESYLEQDFLTRDLDRLAPHLWLVGAQDSSHISSLTQQIFRGRDIVLTEDPGLHLLWIYDRVYIKPIPKYLLSRAFWEFYLVNADSPIKDKSNRGAITKAALGFLRTYFHLIQHKSDFFLATKDEKLRLLPKDVSYADFVKFIVNFSEVHDDDVSPRYRFGQLRLSRLNFWSKIFLHRFQYRKVHQQYGAYFARFYGPLLFIFATVSLSLSAMQLVLAVQRPNAFGESWKTFARVSGGFAVFTLVCVALIVFFLLSMFISLALREIIFAIKALYRGRKLSGKKLKESKLKTHDMEN